ncbi:hypothetical protein ABTJ39_19325, partial [Acinetobacter baumannii]
VNSEAFLRPKTPIWSSISCALFFGASIPITYLSLKTTLKKIWIVQSNNNMKNFPLLSLKILKEGSHFSPIMC